MAGVFVILTCEQVKVKELKVLLPSFDHKTHTFVLRMYIVSNIILLRSIKAIMQHFKSEMFFSWCASVNEDLLADCTHIKISCKYGMAVSVPSCKILLG